MLLGWTVLCLSSLKFPPASLSGNNLIFANYINEFASEDAFYFIPSSLDGTLNAALQSAAPTRNGISIYTASNNLFYLTTSFANHIRNQQSEDSCNKKNRCCPRIHCLLRAIDFALRTKKTAEHSSRQSLFDLVRNDRCFGVSEIATPNRRV